MTLLKSLLFLIFSNYCFAQSNTQYLQLNKFLVPENEEHNDITYMYMAPQFEENPDPNKTVVIEYYFGEYDSSEQSGYRLDLIKEIIQDDRRINSDYPVEILGINAQSEDESDSFREIIHHLDLNKADKQFEKIPETIYFNPEVYQKTTSVKKDNDRIPSGFSPGRNFWTFMRFSSSFGASYAALVLTEGIAPGIAASVGLWPGLASGAITYFNGAYGKFLTNGSWTKWVLNSETKFAGLLRSGLGLNPKNLSQYLIKKQKQYSKSPYFKELLSKNPEEFARIVEKDAAIAFSRAENRFGNIVKKFGMIDEYIKWWATEVAFVTTAIKLPQAVAGVGATASVMGAVGDVLSGATMGMLAQGPGDLAIQKRKYQKINELEQIVKSGKKIIENADELIKEIDLIKAGKASIGNQSHQALRKIENWARSRATMLSFISVAGVGMEIAGIPLARPILIGVGIGGGFYYSQVAGWITMEKVKKLFTHDIKNYFGKLVSGEIKFSLQGLLLRLCTGKFKQA